MTQIKDKIQTFDEQMMQRCFQLAKNGLGYTAPNPIVGCVITYEDKIVGEGYHRKIGGPHAEVNAINAVPDKSILQHCTLYVNLEPCAHHGKTPPCSDLIIQHKIPRVVIANVDPYAKVAGKGIKKLEAAGCKVEYGLLKNEGWFLNRRFFTFHTRQRPWIILKWAESADGYIDRKRKPEEHKKPQWLTNQNAKHLVHKWRKEEQAILAGNHTVLLDNPQLNIREWAGINPLRIVLDAELSLPNNLHITDGRQQTYIFNLHQTMEQPGLKYIQLNSRSSFLEEMLAYLYENNIQSVLAEGGAQVLASFLSNNLWDEARRFVGPLHLTEGVEPPVIHQVPDNSLQIGDTMLHTYYNYSNIR